MRRTLMALLAGSLLAISMAGAGAAFSPSAHSPWVMLDGRDAFCTAKDGATGTRWQNTASGAELCWPL